MNTLLLCLIITAIIVFVWDYVAFPQEVANMLASKLTKGKINFVYLKKPFGCSTCMTFWVTLVVILVLNPMYWFMPFVYAFFAKYVLYIYTLADTIICKLFELIEKPFTKI